MLNYILFQAFQADCMNQAQYVNPFGIQGSPQPFVCENMNLYGFILEGDQTNLQALCDRYLNNPADDNLYYTPITHHVMLSFAHLKSLRSLNPPFSNTFWMPEREVVFWVLVAACKREGGVLVAQHLAWFTPYMYVDNPIALIAGREVYGMPKQFGWFDMPDQGNPGDSSFSAEAIATTTFSRESEAVRQPIFKINHLNPEPVPPVEMWSDVKSAFSSIRKLVFDDQPPVVPGITFFASLFEGLLHHEVQMVMLKQFPDVANGNLASYQAIVEAPIKITNFRSGHLLGGNYEFELHNVASYPIKHDLGLKLAGDKQKTAIAFWMNYDFELEAGKEIWRANPLPPPQPSGCLPMLRRLLGLR